MEDTCEKNKELNALKTWVIWNISNWDSLLTNDELLEKEKKEFAVGGGNRLPRTTWEVGLMVKPEIRDEATFYWTLKKFDQRLSQVHAAFSFQFLDKEGKRSYNRPVLKGQRIAEINKVNVIDTWHSIWRSRNCEHKDKDGDISIKVKIFLMFPDPIPSSLSLAMKTTRKRCTQNMITNYSALLNDPSTADLKIIMNDGLEITAHKIILTAQCPVFATMFRSQFSESTTGVIKVDDINGKTMGLILHYLYTGQVLPTWRDQDVIVDLTYAAGKYELEEILKMLDCVLGDRDDCEASNIDIILLSLSQKLSLGMAEAALLRRILGSIEKFKSFDQFIDLLGFDKEVISLRAGQIVFENPEIAKALENCEDLLAEEKTPEEILQTTVIGSPETSCHDLFLACLANEYLLKRVEGCLIKRMIDKATKCKNGDELMGLFDVDKPQNPTIVVEEKSE